MIATLLTLGAAAAMPMPMPATTGVSVGYSTFAPARVQVLAGDTVTWRNDSVRDHTVNGDGFASGHIVRSGRFSHTFATTGDHPYFCSLHAGMTGDVAVEPLLVDPPPPSLEGRPVVLTGRAQAGVAAVRLERDSGAGFVPVGEAPVDEHGAFRAALPASPTARYRAVAAGGLVSPTVRVVVQGQQVVARATAGRGRATVRVTTVPARPHATVVLQVYERERFGFWPERRARLDRSGRATLVFRLRRSARARVVLVARDGATPLATSRHLKLNARR